MPGCFKKASPLPISHRLREILEQIVRRNKSQQQHVKRAQIILLGSDGFGNVQIADKLSVDRKTVYHWRERWLSQTEQLLKIETEADDTALSKAMLSFLSDAPRPGTPATYTPEMVCQIIAISCEAPSNCGYPISHWTPQVLRLEVIKRGIVEDISVRSVGRFLKGSRSQAPSGALLGTVSRTGRR
jgi:putative transposase